MCRPHTVVRRLHPQGSRNLEGRFCTSAAPQPLGKCRHCSRQEHADYRAQILENQLSGLLLKVNNSEVWTRLIGNFNAYNVLAIYATAELLGSEKVEILRLISELESVSGRFQYLISEDKITAIIDYAHTPDALKNVLETINSIRTKNEELITVVGCGGDRDKTKRPEMAKIAADNSNKVILTSDNPRSEDPDQIIAEMESGVKAQNFKKTWCCTCIGGMPGWPCICICIPCIMLGS